MFPRVCRHTSLSEAPQPIEDPATFSQVPPKPKVGSRQPLSVAQVEHRKKTSSDGLSRERRQSMVLPAHVPPSGGGGGGGGVGAHASPEDGAGGRAPPSKGGAAPPSAGHTRLVRSALRRARSFSLRD